VLEVDAHRRPEAGQVPAVTRPELAQRLIAEDARAMVAASEPLPSGWMIQASARIGRKLADVLDTRRF